LRLPAFLKPGFRISDYLDKIGQPNDFDDALQIWGKSRENHLRRILGHVAHKRKENRNALGIDIAYIRKIKNNRGAMFFAYLFVCIANLGTGTRADIPSQGDNGLRRYCSYFEFKYHVHD